MKQMKEQPKLLCKPLKKKNKFKPYKGRVLPDELSRTLCSQKNSKKSNHSFLGEASFLHVFSKQNMRGWFNFGPKIGKKKMTNTQRTLYLINPWVA